MGRKKVNNIWYPSARVHHLTVFMYDKQGNLVMSESKIIDCIKRHEGGFATYAYILHDKDVYDAQTKFEYQEKNRKTFIDAYQNSAALMGLEKDETSETGYVERDDLLAKAHEYADKQFPPIEAGQLKPAHWHIILTFSHNRRVDEIARWFSLEPNWNEAKTGRGAAENAWSYLVHAHDPAKFQYSSTEVRASFDYAVDLEARIEKEVRHEKYAINPYDLNDVLEEISVKGLSLREAQKRVTIAVYLRNKTLFENARKEYVLNYAPMPLFREVFYVESKGIDEDHGKGGLGKSVCSKAFAKQLAKEFGADISKHISDLREYIYVAGDAKVFLQEYDAQPILLIDEINGTDFKRAMKGVNGVKSILDPFPERKSVDKKHGAVVCTAKYIIINGIQSFEAFKRDLAGEMFIDGVKQESEQSVKEQFDRRFWGNIRIIDSSEIEFWANRGLFENTPEKGIMEMIGRVRANFHQIALSTTGEAQARIEGQVLNPMLLEVEKSQETHAQQQKISNPDDLPPELLRMGELITDDEDYELVEEQLELPMGWED